MKIATGHNMIAQNGNRGAYAAPTLVVYGKVSALTAAGSTAPTEPTSGSGSPNQKR